MYSQTGKGRPTWKTKNVGRITEQQFSSPNKRYGKVVRQVDADAETDDRPLQKKKSQLVVQ